VVDALAPRVGSRRPRGAAGHHRRASTCPVERTWIYDHARTAAIGDTTIKLTHVQHVYRALASRRRRHDHTVGGAALAAGRTPAPVVTTNHGS
jgi:hypothetical protein